MSSKKELDKLLDQIPADYPYEVVADIRAMHDLLHQAGKTDSTVAQSFTNRQELIEALRNFQPSEYHVARELAKKISGMTGIMLTRKGTDKALEIAYQVFIQHDPVKGINHSY